MDTAVPTEKECKTCKVFKKCEDFYANRKECKECYLAKRRTVKCAKSEPRQVQQVRVVQQVDQPKVNSNGFTEKQMAYLISKNSFIPFTVKNIIDPTIDRIVTLEDELHNVKEELHTIREENKQLKSDLNARLEGKQSEWLAKITEGMRGSFYDKEDVADYVEKSLRAKDDENLILKERLKRIEYRLPPMSPISPNSPPSSFIIPCTPPMDSNYKPLPLFVKKVKPLPIITKNVLPPIRFA